MCFPLYKRRTMTNPSSHDQKKKTQTNFQKNRLDKYFYHPPYGTRFWILSPFLNDDDSILKEQIRDDFGMIGSIRPMYKEDIF